MDPNDEDTNVDRRRKNHIVCAAVATSAAAAAVAVALDSMTKQPYRRGSSNSQIDYSGRPRGRPRGGSSSSQQSKKKKGIAEKLTTPLNNMAAALQTMVVAATTREFAREVNEAVNEMDKYDTIDKKTRARLYLLHHNMEANSILSAPKEDRFDMLEGYMRVTDFNS